MENKIKNNLLHFHKELKNISSRDIQIIYATKYLNPQQFVSFISICEQIDPSPRKYEGFRTSSLTPVMVGENRVQDAEEKINYITKLDPTIFARGPLANPLAKMNIVMIGNLQKNKINRAIELFDEVHSVDSIELAQAFNTRLEKAGKSMPIFLEVNVSGEKTKHGFSPAELALVIKSLKLLKSLKLKGLMTMAPQVENTEEVRPIFRRLKQLANKHNLMTSMGMSRDWKVAVDEGSDIIRIGSRIFSTT